MRNKIIVLVGKSSSGKTTVCNQMCENMGYRKIVTYTTRPKRDGEQDGIDYHFISKQEFIAMVNDGKFVEHMEYKVGQETYCYGTSVQSVKNAEMDEENRYVLIVDCYGLMELLRLKINVMALLVHMDDRDRFKRQIDRGDDIVEIALREVRDKPSFEKIDKLVDHTVVNIVGNVDFIMEQVKERTKYRDIVS